MSTKLPTMSLDSEMTSGYNWQELDESKYRHYKPKFIKRFKINDVVDEVSPCIKPKNLLQEEMKRKAVDRNIRDIIKGKGFERFILMVDFEIEVDGKKYILSTEMQDENDKHVSGVDANVYFICETSESERFLNDAVEKLDLSQEDKEEMRTYFEMRAYFYSELPGYDVCESSNSLTDLIKEMDLVTDIDVFDTLRKRVQACALKDYGIDLEAIEREEEREKDESKWRRKVEFPFPSF